MTQSPVHYRYMGIVASSVLSLCFAFFFCLPTARSQDELLVEDGPLIDQQPFDLIHLTADAGGGTFKVFPLPFPNRQVPDQSAPNAKIEVIFQKFPDRRYSIAWKWIHRIELFEDLVLKEAKERLAEKDFIGAFYSLSYLMRNYPETPRLEPLRLEFLFSSLAVSYSNKQLEQTLSTLEELKRSAPEFREESVSRALNNVASALLERYENRNDFGSIRTLLGRLKNTHGPIDVVTRWEAKIRNLAKSKQSEAETFYRENRYREAYMAAYAAMGLVPNSQEANQLIKRLAQTHPMVRVGVMQLSKNLDPTCLIDWASRRSGLLVYQPVFQFLQTGNEGGTYAFALGKHRLSDDRQSLQLNIDSKNRSALEIVNFSQLMLERADPRHPLYDPVWASIFDSVRANGASQLEVNLQRPNVLPHAMMQWVVTSEQEEGEWLPGPFQRTLFENGEAVYALRPQWSQSGLPMEVIEVFYDDAQQAINDLARGYIDVIDQLFPADARSLMADSRFRTMSYALPSTHLLIPVSDHAYLSQEKFRRALLYATDRNSILQGELLGSTDVRDGRLVSGPFPMGISDTDPLAYAYNRDVPPVAYNAQLAKVLLTIVGQELEKTAQKSGEKAPSLEKLVVGCPDFQFAKVAVQALIQQWAVIGIEAEMRVLADHEDPNLTGLCDLMYVTTSLWEPAADIQRLLGGSGPTASDNPFIVQGLIRIREAKNWREVRTALQDLHRIVAYHLPILPLWQVTDRFAFRRGIQGIQDRPVSLYQNISNWRLDSSTAAGSSLSINSTSNDGP